MFPYDPEAIVPSLEELERWRALLDYRGPLPRSWEGRSRRDLQAEAVAASTSMEGVPVTVEEVHRILAGDRPPTTTPEDAALVRGYREAMEFSLRRADDPGFGWDRGQVIAIHDRVLAGRFSEGAGSLRTSPTFVANSLTGEVVFMPPPADDVPMLLDEALARMQAGHPHVAIAAAWVHLVLAAIHPFRDGNGRTARVCSSLAMLRGGFKRTEFTSLEEWWGHHLADYYGAFLTLGSRFDHSADATAFIRQHVTAQLHQVRALDLRERTQRQVWLVIEEAIDDAGLHRRVANAVWEGFFGRTVTSRYYRGLTDVGEVTAATDLKGAVAAGFLSAVGAGRARHYVAGRDLYRRIGDWLDLDVRDTGEIGRQHVIGALIERSKKAASGPPTPTEG